MKKKPATKPRRKPKGAFVSLVPILEESERFWGKRGHKMKRVRIRVSSKNAETLKRVSRETGYTYGEIALAAVYEWVHQRTRSA